MGDAAGIENVRDRVVELRRVKASRLRRHPRNWRVHGTEQARALHDVLREIGWSGALLARQLPDGELELIDGHLRAEAGGEQEVPVLVLDVDEEEADRLLATFDPLGAMAGCDARQLDSLLQRIDEEHRAVCELVRRWADTSAVGLDASAVETADVTDSASSGSDGAPFDAESPRMTHGEGPGAVNQRRSVPSDSLLAEYQIVVDCQSEAKQKELYERLTGEGWVCRLLIL